ncbi:MAG: hypothetical protein V2I35_11485 [Desulfocapsaceae bacterium]|jgi:hypothetical protein|nr:hypothetical protein [Desulfocapsaceae bacterium]
MTDQDSKQRSIEQYGKVGDAYVRSETHAKGADLERIRDPSHNRAYSEKEWRAMFEKAGFSIEHTEPLTKRHELLKWGKRMNNSIETLQELIQIVKNGSSAVVEWMQPLPDAGSFDAPEASFVNHQIIIAGRKRI